MSVWESGDGRAAHITVDSRGIDIRALVDRFMPTPEDMERAVASANSKTMRWARALAVREIRKDIGVPAALLRARITVHRYRDDKGRFRLFFGLRPIPAAILDPKQTRSGVRVKGGGSLSGAFLVDMGGYDAVFKRADKDRYPLVYQRIRFHEEAYRVIAGDIVPQWENEFLKHFERELQWRTR